jgi:hypothetical protein
VTIFGYQVTANHLLGPTITIAGLLSGALAFLTQAQTYCPNLPPQFVPVIAGLISLIGLLKTFLTSPPQKVSPPA